jgi:hypothetical protein
MKPLLPADDGSPFSHSIEPDPIFPAIAKHRDAFECFSDELKINENATVEEEAAAFQALVATKPTTLAGLMAFCRYFATTAYVQDNSYPDRCVEVVFETVVEALSAISANAADSLSQASHPAQSSPDAIFQLNGHTSVNPAHKKAPLV